MFIKELLPAIESAKGNLKYLAGFFDRTQVQGVLSEGTKDEEEAVSAVRDDGIRKDGVGGMRIALIAGKAADADADLHRMTVKEFDQGAVVVSVDMKIPFASTIRAGLSSWLQMPHVFIKNSFSESFFANKLAIDQVLSYHIYA